MATPVLLVSDVHKSYSTGSSGQLHVLRGATLSIAKGQVCAIVGASGAGKSTLLHIIGALDTPSRGTVHIDGRDVFAMSDREIAAYRNRHIGFVFQFHHLLPEFTATENVAMPALIAGERRATAEKRARELMARVRVDHRADAKPSELSGGEQQRVAVARALMNDPGVVLADEPSGNLDEGNAEMLHALIWELARERRQTFVLVTHDEALARKADVVFALHEGILAERQHAS
jgi:lipoprotein-releasing system ATP-binding protein